MRAPARARPHRRRMRRPAARGTTRPRPGLRGDGRRSGERAASLPATRGPRRSQSERDRRPLRRAAPYGMTEPSGGGAVVVGGGGSVGGGVVGGGGGGGAVVAGVEAVRPVVVCPVPDVDVDVPTAFES